MAYETLVAVYDSTKDATEAVRDLEACGVRREDIEVHNRDAAAAHEKTGQGGSFWSSLFGSEAERDRDVYDRSVATGGQVVAVRAHDEDVEAVTTILDRNGAVDIDERAAAHGGTAPETTRPAAKEGRMDLAQEQLEVGKRESGRGVTRLRRYAVETPVEEKVALRDERVRVDRRPVDRAVAPGDDAFSEKTVEASEVHEEPVASKKARVVEEVGLKKEGGERVETVRDTVRHDEVEVERDEDVRRRAAGDRR